MVKEKAACCDKTKVKKGYWSAEEDLKLTSYILKFGHANWRVLPQNAGLLRCGKSCRLRWINYLNPALKRGKFTPEEENMIIDLHVQYGNKWSKIASNLPGRTDNEIKNVWHTYLKKRTNIENNIANPNVVDPTSPIEPKCASEEKTTVLQCPSELNESSFATRVFSLDDLMSSSSYSTFTPNISSLDNNVIDDDLFQTSLDPDFDFWFMLDSIEPNSLIP